MLLRRIIIALVSLAISSLLILSIPVINFFIRDGLKKKDPVEVARVETKKVEIQKKKSPPEKKLKRPQRQKPTRTNVRSGPRFAMDLGVSGAGGVAVNVNTVQAGRGGEKDEGEVDERPVQNGEPPLVLPDAVRESGTNARAVLNFCVDNFGNAYDIQIVEELPVGLGMGQAAREAVKNVRFSPAKKEGRPVAFCGMQQPFEVRFD